MTRKHQADATITTVEHFSETYHRLTFRAPQIAADAWPGQFVTIRLDQPGFPVLRRPFSIHRVVDQTNIQILFKMLGQGTRQLADCRAGDAINVLGPLGNGVFEVDRARPEVLLVAGGIGIAPLLFLAETKLAACEVRPRLLFGGAGAGDLPASEDFRRLNCDLHLVTEDGSVGRRGLVTDELRDILTGLDPSRVQVMACGPLPMLRAVAALCLPRKVRCQVSLETVMACGVGSCFGCAIEMLSDCADAEVDYRRVCHDGPVFEAAAIRWSEEE